MIDGSPRGSINTQLGLRPGDWGYDPTNPKTNDIVKTAGKLIGPTTTILVLDSDQDSSTNWNQMNNWPEDHNNHGSEGLNIGFGDGHVEFVSRGPGLILTYLAGYQGPAQDPAFSMSVCPGLSIQTSAKIGTKTGTIYTYP